jgi:hypothetical protein
MGEHTARMGEKNAYKHWSETLKGRDYLEELGIDIRKILEGS